MPKDVAIKSSALKSIIKRINEGKCLVILGPHLLGDGGKSINAEMNSYLTENLGNKVRYYEEEGFLSFDNRTREIFIEDPIEEFFEGLEPNEMYQKIAEIPFSLILNTAPDTTLNKAFDAKGIAYDYDFYHKRKPPQEPLKKHGTYIYNLFGDYHEIDSMILTYQDLYEYLQSIMGVRELKIKSQLHEAKAVLFFGFSFDKWYYQLLLWLMDVENKALNSHDISQKNIKSFYHEEFNVEFFDDETAAEIIDELYQAKLSGSIEQPENEVYQPEIFISYAWGGASGSMADALEKTMQENQIRLIRDINELSYKELITDFMNRIGKARAVILVISKAYLESKNCMYELTEIYSNENFEGRIFPIYMDDANIFDSLELLKYQDYWKEERNKLDNEVSKRGMEGFKALAEEYQVIERINEKFNEVTKLLKDMNGLSPKEHLSTNFQALLEAIKKTI